MGNRFSLLVLSFLFFMVSCNKDYLKLSRKQIKILSHSCQVLIDTHTEVTENGFERINEVELNNIRKIVDIKSAFIVPKGVYLKVESYPFGQETGYFYLNSASKFEPLSSVEPQYTVVADKLFVYCIH
jgi:hypothetical protein